MLSLRSSLVLVPFFALGCASSAGTSPSDVENTPHATVRSAVDANEPFVATITAFKFPQISVPAGTTVRWVNNSRAPHTVTSGSGSDDPNVGALFDATIRPGQSFEFTFKDAGDMPYFCRFHEEAGMVGTVVVTDAPAPSDPAQ
jgi:plastocyanin